MRVMTVGDFLHPVEHGDNGRFVGGQQRFSELQIDTASP